MKSLLLGNRRYWVLEKQGQWCDEQGHCFDTPQGLAGHIRATGHPVKRETEEGLYPPQLVNTVTEAYRIASAYGGARVERTESGFRVVPSKIKTGQQFGQTFIKRTTWRGIRPEPRKEIESTITSIFNEFDINPIREIQSKPFSGYRETKAIAAMTGSGKMELNTLKLGSKERWEEGMRLSEAAPDIVRRYMNEFPEKFPEWKKEMAERLLSFDRQLVDESIRGVIIHEIGHHLDMEHLYSDERRTSVVRNMEKYVKGLSARASDSPREYIAESFVAYINGEKIDPVLKEMFDNRKRKK